MLRTSYIYFYFEKPTPTVQYLLISHYSWSSPFFWRYKVIIGQQERYVNIKYVSAQCPSSI